MNWIKDKLKRFWKWTITLFVGGVVVASVVGFPPIEVDHLKDIENERDNIFSAIESGQTNAIAQKGKYVQGVFTTSKEVGLASSSYSLDKSRKSSDTTEDWNYFNLPSTLKARYWVDVYGGPLGQGYTMFAEYYDKGFRYVYKHHVGPETHRNALNDTWQKYEYPAIFPK